MAQASVHVSDLQDHKGAFFKVLHTTERSQAAMMTIPSGQEAGAPETHPDSDQVFYIVEGRARIRTWDDGDDQAPKEHTARPGTVVVVPAGIRHWVKSEGDEALLFFTVYGPPEY